MKRRLQEVILARQMSPNDPQWQGQPEDFPLRKTGKNLANKLNEIGPDDSEIKNREFGFVNLGVSC